MHVTGSYYSGQKKSKKKIFLKSLRRSSTYNETLKFWSALI